ncbi:hypothetical protein T552_00493 [Pneumocystis carinii B80]|uniref:K Homology domain-containing protein n=1 Tax=Pneumocystis carinii (strain B80) TaxID=1408658 RepID=A0A0W4ZQY4_PNEC8|nr:hypothetical protein T552_00493 [Pneumocystis carinii B80]KTW30781.1 hypothetical protein T552_00493 [Pneumocystis carinii B80]
MSMNLSLEKDKVFLSDLQGNPGNSSFVHTQENYMNGNGDNSGLSSNILDNKFDNSSKKHVGYDTGSNYSIIGFNSEESFPSLKSSIASATKKSKTENINISKSNLSEKREKYMAVPSIKTTIETIRLEASQRTPLKEFGSKSSVAEIARQIMEETHTHIDMSTTRKTGITTFLVRGKPEDVHRARRMLMKELSQKVTIKLSVPLNILGFIIGIKGKVLNGIIEKSGAKIQFPKRNISRDFPCNNANGEHNDETVEIIISGDVEAAELAKKEIEAIVEERTSHITVKITSINPKFYSLISSANNSGIQEWARDKDLKIDIPSSYLESDVEKLKPIVISGEKNLVNTAKAEIEALYAEFKSTTVSASVVISKRLHKYLDEKLLQDILYRLKCSIIIPPYSSPSESLLICGPPSFIGESIQCLMERANSIYLDMLDITKAHPSAADHIAHARDITRYFLKKKEIARIEKKYQIQITLPSMDTLLKQNLTSIIYEFAGENAGNVKNAKKEIIMLINSYPPYRILRLNLDPLLHCHIIGQKGRNLQKIREQYFIDVLFSSEDSFNSEIVLIYEGRPDEKLQPAVTIQLTLEKVAELLKKTATEMADIISRDIYIPDKYHKYILGPKGSTLNSIIKDSNSIVKVKFSTAKPRKFDNTVIEENMVNVRGVSFGVEYVIKEIEKIVENLKFQDQNSYTSTFDFPQKFLKYLFDKGHNNISKIRELNVKITTEEGKITVQGAKENVEEAKSYIQELIRKLDEQTVLHLSIPVKHHGSLIGQGGKFVKRLEEKYQVKINFPRENLENKDTDTKKSEAKDEVTIRGEKNGIALAKLELMDLLDYEKEHGNTVTFTVPMFTIAQILGKAGNSINELKNETETRIEIEKSTSDDPSALATIFIQGTKDGIKKAKNSILNTVKAIQDQVTRTIYVNRKHHRTLIGPGGSTLRNIITECGAIGDRSQLAKIIQFPKPEKKSDEIVIAGNKELVDKIIEKINFMVKEIEEKTTLVIPVPLSKMKAIVGKEGNVRKELESKYSVIIKIPRKPKDSTEKNVEIKVIGKKDQVDKAAKEINTFIKTEDCIEINIPLKCHPYISENGIFARRMKTLYGVILEYHEDSIPKETIDEADIDENDVDENRKYPWSVVMDLEEDKEISWTLKGKMGNIEQVKEIINTALEQMKHHTATGYLKVPPNYYGIIIGQGGSRISQIKNESDCCINIPRTNNGNLITLRGTLDGLEKARAMIIDTLGYINNKDP